MSRKLLATLAALAVGLAAAAVGAAGGQPSSGARTTTASPAPPAPSGGAFALAAARGTPAGGPQDTASADLADAAHQRADAAARLHARRFDRGRRRPQLLHGLAERLDVSDARLHSAVRAVWESLRDEGVDLRTATPAQLATLKTRLADRLAESLDRPVGTVLAAVRVELERKLGMGVGLGVLSTRGRDLALACFDDPAACDVDALRSELHAARRGR